MSDMEVIAVSFGEEESSQLNDLEYMVGWCKHRGYTLDLDNDHLHDGNGHEVTCSVLGPYIVFKEKDQPFPLIVFDYILALTDQKGVISMMEADDDSWPIPGTKADLYISHFVKAMEDSE
jgi:hypothetical protein|tara:strand:- start:654 stop:1013 length:360 start_codon:yes stop_codon:yes gene_type:complete